VLEIAPASGSQFSLLPPDNATGNFTKVVQRIPVKIALDDSAFAPQTAPRTLGDYNRPGRGGSRKSMAASSVTVRPSPIDIARAVGAAVPAEVSAQPLLGILGVVTGAGVVTLTSRMKLNAPDED